MSYTQTFKGELAFADAHCLEAGLDAFVEDLRDSILSLDHLRLDGTRVKIDMDCTAPASMYDPTLIALGRLAEFAASGRVATTFHLDGVSRDRVDAARRRSPEGLPPAHRRWEIYQAAGAGDAGALGALQADGISLAATFPASENMSTLHLAAQAGSADA